MITGLTKGTVTVTATTVDDISGSATLEVAENLLIYNEQDPYFDKGVDIFNLIYTANDDVSGGSCSTKFEEGVGISIDQRHGGPDRFCANNGTTSALSGKGYLNQYYAQKSIDSPMIESNAAVFKFLNPSHESDPERTTDTYRFRFSVNVNAYWDNEIWNMYKIVQNISIFDRRYYKQTESCTLRAVITNYASGYNISYSQTGFEGACGTYRPFENFEAIFNRETGWLIVKGFFRFGEKYDGGSLQALEKLSFAPWIDFDVGTEHADELITGVTPLDEFVLFPYYGDI
jgi:hypothetical protein